MRVIIPFFYFFGFPNATMKYQDSSYHLSIKSQFDSCKIEFYQSKDSLSFLLNNIGRDTISFKYGCYMEQFDGNSTLSFSFYIDSASTVDSTNGRTIYHLMPNKQYHFNGIDKNIKFIEHGDITHFYWFLEIGRYRKKLHKIQFK